MSNYSFSIAERYAVWLHHDKRCWLCEEPLRLQETTIDHVLPEALLNQPHQLADVFRTWGLPDDFELNGFGNWLPCHARCNQQKAAKKFKFTPSYHMVLEGLNKRANEVKKTAVSIGADTVKDKLIGLILAALEKQTISLSDLQIFSLHPPEESAMIRLDNGYWLHKKDVARECDCQCERQNCVDSIGKLHCYFARDLSTWVVQAGLYWKCYDEVTPCSRCGLQHRRGHVGRAGTCLRPYVNQSLQTDEL